MTLQPLGDVRRNVNIPLVWRYESQTAQVGTLHIDSAGEKLIVTDTVTVQEASLVRVRAEFSTYYVGGANSARGRIYGDAVLLREIMARGDTTIYVTSSAEYIVAQAVGAVAYSLKVENLNTANHMDIYNGLLSIDVARA